MTVNGRTNKALDVWLRFDAMDEDVEAEANTFQNDDGTYRVEWYLTAVGLVTSVEFPTYEAATEWLEFEGFTDFTVED